MELNLTNEELNELAFCFEERMDDLNRRISACEVFNLDPLWWIERKGLLVGLIAKFGTAFDTSMFDYILEKS